MWLFSYNQRNDGKDAFVQQDQGLVFLVPTGFSHHESGNAHQWGWGHSLYLGDSSQPGPHLYFSNDFPVFAHFFCSAWYPDSKDIMCVVCKHLHLCVCWRGWAPSTLTYWASQMTTATPHVMSGQIYDSCWGVIEQPWHLRKISDTVALGSGWIISQVADSLAVKPTLIVFITSCLLKQSALVLAGDEGFRPQWHCGHRGRG